jgi:UDPglucose--hexose-1-phosphate uridylyltransferase
VVPALQVWKSAAALADGREIIYFDEAAGLGRDQVPDSRELPPAISGGELRFDPLLGDWVAYATSRQDRTFLPAAGSCPLCPSRPGRPTEIPAASYDVVVFENRFPVLRGPAQPAGLPAGGLSLREPAAGRCEVVCFTADHDASLAGLTAGRVATVLTAWADRTASLAGLPGIAHVLCLENRGQEVGVTLQHPHGQVYALPFVPPRTRTLLASAHRHRSGCGGNLFDDLLAAELADGRRIVQRNEHWVAFVPAAARWPFEVLVFPVRRVPDLTCLPPDAVAAFGELYPAVLRRLDALFGAPMPYMTCWQQAPLADAAARAEFALHLQVMTAARAPGKLKFRASTESGAGVWSNDVLPETAARMLREACG